MRNEMKEVKRQDTRNIPTPPQILETRWRPQAKTSHSTSDDPGFITTHTPEASHAPTPDKQQPTPKASPLRPK
ncbi:uncharacterized protein MYCFIDRAFT_176945 [Pseudocercospora fijiensis CIRAD86]|uniref:Uncharacterized protein n=1 Tax=Pseudocercospora fijiensis (strain CIRAD86) TaxID=383855 RepID=M2YQE4_PSEFD|nr:uncharacterized protein MYCFIDRAFT_176945 [Pseudocercospora fijiensis CIRAD86]EME79945.1 hypothetical protein MYCFIDRAFT_176945 [Pseudocercospora fijiensis CIRAD86]